MLDKYLLIISDNENGFTVNSLSTAISKESILIKNISISDSNLLNYCNDAFGILIVDSFENSYSMNAIKSKCHELNLKVILFGNPEELSTMKRIFTDNIIYKEYIRPVDFEEIIHGIKKLQVKMENQSVMKKVLVVDDDGVFLRTIMDWLDGKYLVSVANSATNALNVIKSTGAPDLILLDYEMPVCSGAQLMEMLSGYESTKEIPIIFLTSRNDAETVNEVVHLKPKGYILKTTTREQILKKIEDFFDSLIVTI